MRKDYVCNSLFVRLFGYQSEFLPVLNLPIYLFVSFLLCFCFFVFFCLFYDHLLVISKVTSFSMLFLTKTCNKVSSIVRFFLFSLHFQEMVSHLMLCNHQS